MDLDKILSGLGKGANKEEKPTVVTELRRTFSEFREDYKADAEPALSRLYETNRTFEPAISPAYSELVKRLSKLQQQYGLDAINGALLEARDGKGE